MHDRNIGGSVSKEAINPELLEILVCPMCKQKIELKGEELVCVNCGRSYPITNGIPNMIPWEAKSG